MHARKREITRREYHPSPSGRGHERVQCEEGERDSRSPRKPLLWNFVNGRPGAISVIKMHRSDTPTPDGCEALIQSAISPIYFRLLWFRWKIARKGRFWIFIKFFSNLFTLGANFPNHSIDVNYHIYICIYWNPADNSHQSTHFSLPFLDSLVEERKEEKGKRKISRRKLFHSRRVPSIRGLWMINVSHGLRATAGCTRDARMYIY